MKRALLKTAFALAVFGLTIVTVIPVMMAWQVVFATQRGAAGYHQAGGGPGLLLSIVVLVLSLTISDRIVSRLFYASGLSDERWSIVRGRPRLRKTN
jgi:hypothetical protein